MYEDIFHINYERNQGGDFKIFLWQQHTIFLIDHAAAIRKF